MGMPSKLKNMNLYNDGQSYLGVVTAVTVPKLTRKMEAFRGGGMLGSAKADFGLDDDAMKMEWTIGGYVKQILQQYGAVGVDGVQLRFAAAFQRDDTQEVDSVEIVVRGRHSEIDRGESKVGDDTEVKITTECVYYKETLNGETLYEIDLLNMIQMVGGVDVTESLRRAIGL
ncbi:phage major tail tube protein [Achromobacter xylosoxidans]|uniref:phage major tail tube protein n=2 Tax=Alcaligenes xylosoxydans xylosoxydans TaxID=85698 RepID=UPI0006BF535D|nr:phage major tail tube protein [Achromobacter xylosoxidans]MCH1990901.1 phage major tail tube protein [Achromobacter xylosoxidans]MCH1998248.1 phage major tail tube protein [Achromobacter xylosoxidans]MCH4590485.1 phage major tail tube protein [Achromobacter xylosoxidans]CUI71131.1 phage major tail tube protein [Achromobacter xylosoxidans]